MCGVMLNPGEIEKLIELVASVQAERMVEIGCHEGRTAAALLRAVPSLERYFGVEVKRGYLTALKVQRSEFTSLPGHWAIQDPRFRLLLTERGSFDVTPSQLGLVDAVFIDGDHGAVAVMHDTALARTITKAGGIIMWHDYSNPRVEVTDVLEDDVRHGRIEHILGTWIAYQRVPK